MSFCRYTIQGQYSCKTREDTKWNKSKVTENFSAGIQIPDGEYYVTGTMSQMDKNGPAMYGMPSNAKVSGNGKTITFTEQEYTYTWNQGSKRYEDYSWNLKLSSTKNMGDESTRYRLVDSDGAVAYLTTKKGGEDIQAMYKKTKAFKQKWGKHACGICLQPHMGDVKRQGSVAHLTMKYYGAKWMNESGNPDKLANRIKKKAEMACLKVCNTKGIQNLLDNYGIDAKRSKQN